jgi:hypothetical protein
MTNETKHTPEAEALADAILRAAGSGLRYHIMHKSREAIFTAAQQGIDAARAELLVAAKGAIAALNQSATFPADVEAAKKWLNAAIAKATGEEGKVSA